MEASCFVAISFMLTLAFLGACGSATGSVGAVLGKDVHNGRLYVREVPRDWLPRSLVFETATK